MRSSRRSASRRSVAFTLSALVAALLPACGDSRSGGPAASADLTGRWRVVSGADPHDIELVDRGDSVLLRAGGDEAPAKRTASGVYVGEKAAPEGTLRFTIGRETADRVSIRYRVEVEGTTQEPPAVVYERVRAPSAGSAGTGPATSGADGGGSRPSELVGAWRMTEPGSVGDRTWVTDTHLELEADGRCVTWSRTEGSNDRSEEEPRTPGRWKAEGGQLVLRADAGGDWTPVGRYTLVDGKLVLTAPNGTRKFFDRR